MKNTTQNGHGKTAWWWIPSLYYAQGIPYIIVMTLSVIMYKRLGISNTDIALYTSWLYLPWVIKPLWSPMVDILKTKRFWIVFMQLVIGVGLAGVAFTIPVPDFFQYTLAFFWLLAFSSATHDIAADGFYMLGLTEGEQSFFVGIRSTFYRIAMLTGQGLLVILAGSLESATGLPPVSVKVVAEQQSVVPITFNPSANLQQLTEEEMSFVAPSEVGIPIGSVDAKYAMELFQKVNEWNVENGFYQEEEKREEKELSWWSKTVSIPFKNYLKEKVNHQQEQQNAKDGNIAILPIQLTKKPNDSECVVLNFGREKGSGSIRLMREYRFEFTAENWNKPAFVVVQLDEKLKQSAQAVFKGRSGNITFAWSIVFGIIAIMFACFALYHRIVLPRPMEDVSNVGNGRGVLREFWETFASFFRKKNIGIAIAFLLLYRLAESQLVKMASPFLLDAKETGGLGLATGDVGLVYGTVGMVALTIGGILGGIVAAKKGLKYWLWLMALAINLPNFSYLFLAVSDSDSLGLVSAAIAVEQFGYGFGFTAYMLFMIYISQGKHKTAHYAICTGFMALGMMLPGMISGWLQEIVGYQNFFIWVMICTLPIFLLLPFVKVDATFGRKEKR